MTPVMADDDFKDLAEGLAKLDPGAIQRFADVFGRRFCVYFLKRGLRPSEAEDLAVNCVTDIALKVPHYYRPQQAGGFERWVFVLAYRALIGWIRARPPMPVGTPEEIAPADKIVKLRTEEDSPQLLAVIEAVHEALQQLSPSEGAVVELRDLSVPHDYEEIGRLLGIPPGTARVYHHRALKQLRGILEGDPRIHRRLRLKTGCKPRERNG